MLTPAKEDPNRKDELARREKNPTAFGSPIDPKAASRKLEGHKLVTEKVAQTTKAK